MKSSDLRTILLRGHDVDLLGATATFEAAVRAECMSARNDNGAYANDAEAYGVLLEELDEFKLWVWMKRRDREPVAMLGELVQVSACARMAAVQLYGHDEHEFDSAVSVAVKCADSVGRKPNSAHEAYVRLLHAVSDWDRAIMRGEPTVRPDHVVPPADCAIRAITALVKVSTWCALSAHHLGLVSNARRAAAEVL